MPKQVQFNDDVVADAEAVAPSFEFPLFAQAAVREKIQREKALQERLFGEAKE
jgi:hypothetical protein